ALTAKRNDPASGGVMHITSPLCFVQRCGETPCRASRNGRTIVHRKRPSTFPRVTASLAVQPVAARKSGSHPPMIAGTGRLFIWFPDLASQATVVHYLTRQQFRIHLAD